MEEKLNKSFFSKKKIILFWKFDAVFNELTLFGAKVKNDILSYTFTFALLIYTKNVD